MRYFYEVHLWGAGRRRGEVGAALRPHRLGLRRRAVREHRGLPGAVELEAGRREGEVLRRRWTVGRGANMLDAGPRCAHGRMFSANAHWE